MSSTRQEVSRACAIKERVELCGHPSLKYQLPPKGCEGCITSSLRGGHAVNFPDIHQTVPEPRPPVVK